jgi:uncharacterized protein (DUF2236 family)
MAIELPIGVPIDGPLELPIDKARRILAGEVTRLVMGDHQPSSERRDEHDDDTGLFGPDSVTWKLHSDFCLLAGGLRALMLQTMHPLAMAGVADHSNYRSDPLGRLANTSAYVGTTVFGSTDQAMSAVATVKRVHRRVVGVASDGRHYDANDPHLLTWVHHTLVDSFLRAFRRYGTQPLTDVEADRYVDEMSVMMTLFEGEPAARSVAELRQYFADIRPELRATREARETMRFLLLPPLPLHTRGPYAMLAAAAVGMLPVSVRRQLWVPTVPLADPLVVRPVCRALFRTLDWVMAVNLDASNRESRQARETGEPPLAE